MSASFDEVISGHDTRIARLEQRAKRLAAKTAITGLSREAQITIRRIDDVNGAIEGLEDSFDRIEEFKIDPLIEQVGSLTEKVDGMYVRFDGIDAKLNAIMKALGARI